MGTRALNYFLMAFLVGVSTSLCSVADEGLKQLWDPGLPEGYRYIEAGERYLTFVEGPNNFVGELLAKRNLNMFILGGHGSEGSIRGVNWSALEPYLKKSIPSSVTEVFCESCRAGLGVGWREGSAWYQFPSSAEKVADITGLPTYGALGDSFADLSLRKNLSPYASAIGADYVVYYPGELTTGIGARASFVDSNGKVLSAKYIRQRMSWVQSGDSLPTGLRNPDVALPRVKYLRAPRAGTRIGAMGRVAGSMLSPELAVEIFARSMTAGDPTWKRLWNIHDSAGLSPAGAYMYGQMQYRDSVAAEQDEYINTVNSMRSAGGLISADAVRKVRSYKQSQQDANWENAAYRELHRCQ